MPDTLVDPPPPPTLRDDALPKPAPSKKRGCLLGVGLAALVTVVGAALLIYVYIFRYEPLARRHVPGNANLVARVSATDIAFFGPVRKHLWPVLFEQAFARSGQPAPAGKSRAQRIRETTGVNLATDVREILVASVDATSWVLLLGGRIDEGSFVDGIEKLAREEGWQGFRREGPLLLAPSMVIGQADDGTIIVGTDTDIVTASLPATDEHSNLGLPDDGAVAFAITEAAWSGVASSIAQKVPGGVSLGQVTRASGRITLGDNPLVALRIEPRAGQDPAPIAADIERSLLALRVLLLLTPDVMGEKEAVAAARVAAQAGHVTVQIPWPLSGLDRACQQLAARARASLDAASAPPNVSPAASAPPPAPPPATSR
jgi:hypothetical protein